MDIVKKQPMRCIVLLLLFPACLQAQPDLVQQLGLHPPEVPNVTAVKDQALSSTCWSFASLSFLESELMKAGHPLVDLSEMFIARYSYLRKIRRYLATEGGVFFTPGGQFHDVMWVIRNYGIVPEEAYPGKLPGAYHNHGELDTLMKHLADRLVKEKQKEPSAAVLDTIYQWLDKYLGKVPAMFQYKGKTFTPKAYASHLGIDPDDYIEITSYRHHPFYQPFVLEDQYNWTGDMYHNVPWENLAAITNEALVRGHTVCWDGDISEPGFLYEEGLAWLERGHGTVEEERQRSFDDKTTAIDHLMHITAAVKDKRGRQWYYVKNSWGAVNPVNGYLFMYDDYFAIKTVAIIVNKKAIPASLLQPAPRN